MWSALGIAVLAALFVIFTYNSLVTLRQRVKNSWAQVEVQLKRRYDLIPNLVSTVKGYAGHEKETLERVTAARAAAIGTRGVNEQGSAENLLTGALRQLFALSESYPELKADTNFRQLQEELTNTEGKIAFARQFFNDTVMKFNTAIQRFPTNLFAGLLGFHQEAYFSLDDDTISRKPVKVDF